MCLIGPRSRLRRPTRTNRPAGGHACGALAVARAPSSGLDGRMELRTKRVYDDPAPADGFRVLVDRLWPRGLSKERAALDLWAKDVAPSTELRRAFHRDGLPWDAFADAYRAELAGPARAELESLRDELARHPVATLLYGVHDEHHNHALLLRDALGL